jgi:DNA-binding NtrC family response regulator
LIPDGADLNFPLLKERFEKEFIIKALTAYRGRINQTAEATQMTKVTLLRKLEKYGIDAKDYFKI